MYTQLAHQLATYVQQIAVYRLPTVSRRDNVGRFSAEDARRLDKGCFITYTEDDGETFPARPPWAATLDTRKS